MIAAHTPVRRGAPGPTHLFPGRVDQNVTRTFSPLLNLDRESSSSGKLSTKPPQAAYAKNQLRCLISSRLVCSNTFFPPLSCDSLSIQQILRRVESRELCDFHHPLRSPKNLYDSPICDEPHEHKTAGAKIRSRTMDKPNALGITADEFKAIEQTRQRLFQLSNSIQGLRMDVLKSNPLPPP